MDDTAALAAAREKLTRAGRTLHDEVGSALSAVTLRLQLLRMDHPSAAKDVDEVLHILSGAVDSIRELSQDLFPPGSPRESKS